MSHNPPSLPLEELLAPQLLEITDTLVRQGYAIVPGLLSPEQCRGLVVECREFRERGEFHPAGVGRGEMQEVRSEIRSDEIRWLDRNDCGERQGEYLDLLSSYQQTLNRELFLGLVEYESFCAVYPPGSFYKRHLDQFRGVELRTVTAILYLNEEWGDEDGGELRIFLDEEGKETLTVKPEAGTFVTFLSANYWHEVLPARRDRHSLTAWFKTRPIGDAFPLQ